MSDHQVTLEPYPFFTGSTVITLNPPIAVRVMHEAPRFSGTVNGGATPTDLSYVGPNRVALECTQVACSQTKLAQLWQWFYDRQQLTLEDLAEGADPANDAFYQTYVGYIEEMPEAVMSPFKSKPTNWTIIFRVNASVAGLM